MATRKELIRLRFQKIVDRDWQTLGAGGTQTQFTVYRRLKSGGRDDLGNPVNVYTKIVSYYPCVFYGLSRTDIRFDVNASGMQLNEREELYTSFNVEEGDQLWVHSEGRSFLVESSTQSGPLYKCQINAGKGAFVGVTTQRVYARARIS